MMKQTEISVDPSKTDELGRVEVTQTHRPMPTCKTCKHWDTMTVGERDKVHWDGYAPKRYCHLIGGDTLASERDVEAAAQGIGGAAITTGPDFGCVHHEPKD